MEKSWEVIGGDDKEKENNPGWPENKSEKK